MDKNGINVSFFDQNACLKGRYSCANIDSDPLFVSVEIISISKTCLYNFDPLKPHFYTVKLGFTGVYINFLISAQKHRLWVPTVYVFEQKYENYQNFLFENFHFYVVKFSVYLNRRVSVMIAPENCRKLYVNDRS